MNSNKCNIYNERLKELLSVDQWAWVKEEDVKLEWNFDTGQVPFVDIDEAAQAREAKVAAMIAKAAAAQFELTPNCIPGCAAVGAAAPKGGS